MHKCCHAWFDGAIVMVVQFLTLGGLCAEQRASAELQVLTLVVNLLIDEEILLFGTNLRNNMLYFRIAKQTQDAYTLTVQQLHRAQ